MIASDWYFDFISPFAYFACLRLDQFSSRLSLTYRPVLLAAILNHWGQKGPAEVPPKREWTYRWCIWWAREHGIAFRMPAAHPFNPIPYLRLALVADCDPVAIRMIFERLWTTGIDPGNPEIVSDLADSIGVELARITDPGVKSALKQQSDEAIARGVFGVPSLGIGDHLFWGADASGLVEAYLADTSLFDTEEMRRSAMLPIGALR